MKENAKKKIPLNFCRKAVLSFLFQSERNDIYYLKLMHWRMQFLSFDWFSGHGI